MERIILIFLIVLISVVSVQAVTRPPNVIVGKLSPTGSWDFKYQKGDCRFVKGRGEVCVWAGREQPRRRQYLESTIMGKIRLRENAVTRTSPLGVEGSLYKVKKK